MNTHELKTKLQKPYNREEWLKVATGIFKNVSILSKPLPIGNAKDFVKSFQQLGFVNLEDGRNLAIIEVKVDDTKKLSSNKVELRNLTAKLIDEHTTNGVLVIYDNDMDGNYRFSFVTKETGINEETGKFETKETSAKRFTYLLGPGESCSTAAMQLSQVAEKGGHAVMEDVIKAFNVEKVNKDFFNGYKKQYEGFVAHLSTTSIKASVFNGDEKAIRDFAKKMMGRIVFIYFLQKKGWMGVPESESEWANGDADFLCNLFNDSGRGEDFYAAWLNNVFFNCLNTERPGQLFKLPNGTKVKVPYLNGGLFEKENAKTDLLTFPSALFQNLFDFLGQYNFTIYEDDPEERFLAVDPEMLGHIFENLLEDNKDKGAFYTPKEIVHYMCRESLIEYLYTRLNPATTESYKEIGKSQTDLFGNKQKKQLSLEETFGSAKEVVKREAIEKLVLHHEAAEIISYEKEILKALYEVKICDPAIGSGAFPMGLLTEIFQLVETLHHITPDVTAEIWKLGDAWNGATVKKQIIQNSIYGVDIERGAVDIARLRFWLSLIIDEEEPKPLPNLDYKIVVGNSLLSKFEDKVIDINWEMNSGKAVDKTRDIILNQEKKLYALQHNQHLYFNQSTGNKKKLQEEIRDIKIDILINQLTLNKISFTEKNPKLGGLLPTPKETQKNLENQLIEKDLDNTIQKLTIIKNNKNLPFNFFDWKLDFAEVLNEKVAKGNVGFDVLIGNPPYIGQSGHRNLFRETLLSDFGVLFHQRRMDYFYFFFHKAIRLAKHNSIITFITTNYFLNATYADKLRKDLYQNCSFLKLVNFNEAKIFESATGQHNAISILINNKNSQLLVETAITFRKGIISSKIILDILNRTDKSSKYYKFSSSDIFDQPKFNILIEGADKVNLSNPKAVLLNSIKEKGRRLIELANINQGIVTGANDLSAKYKREFEIERPEGSGIFILQKNEVDNLVLNDKEKEFIKPWFKNSEVKRWVCNEKNTRYLIYMTSTDEIDESKIPNLINHFKPFKSLLINRNVRTGRYTLKDYENFIEGRDDIPYVMIKSSFKKGKYFLISYARDKSVFEGSKIICPQRSSTNTFGYTEKPWYGASDVYYIVEHKSKKTNLKFLLSILNSKLIYFWLYNKGQRKGETLQLFKDPLSEIPIILASNEIQLKLISIVDLLLRKGKENFISETKELEKQIDLLVYKLYQLTYEEASIVEGNNEWMDKEEYEKFTAE